MSYQKPEHPSLRAWRARRGFTLAKAAKVIGVPLTTYYWIERGGVPRPDLMRRIIDVTGVSAEALTTRVA